MLKNNGKVVYVEPNLEDNYTLYNSQNLGPVYKSINLEDLCITVDLIVEIKSRSSVVGTDGNDRNITLTWQSGESGHGISFMEGTKIYTNKERTEFVRSFTTSYTECNLLDVEKGRNGEMFGIKSIDINYTNFMFPSVTIQFTDVRGVSLFAEEELRHHIEKDGYEHLADNTMEGSFFKSFFTFPYPKYTLVVKGFYGEMVSYELSCSGFNAEFDADTGNFNVVANFLGYSFSFLSDIMVNCLAAAPYSEYLGKEYWEKKVEDATFSLEGSDGTKQIKMPTLGEVCDKYLKIKENVEQSIKDNGGAVEALEAEGVDDEEVERLKENKDKLIQLNATYKQLIADLTTISNNINNNQEPNNNKTGDIAIRPERYDNAAKKSLEGVTNSFAFFVDESDYESDSNLSALTGNLKDRFDEFNLEIHKEESLNCFESDAQELIRNHEFVIQVENDCGDIFEGKKVSQKYIQEEILRNAIEKQAAYQANDDNTYLDMWLDWYNSTVVWYQDFDLGLILTLDVNEVQNTEKDGAAAIERAENILVQKEFKKVFGFEPTVENITKIIMAHLETYIYMVCRCAENINMAGQKRSVENLGLLKNLDDLPDIGGNSSNIPDSSTIVPPFPKITTLTTKNGVTRRETEWIGKLLSRDQAEEIKLIEGILNGAGELQKVMNQESPSGNTENGGNGGGGKNPILHPITYYDLGLNVGDNIFGNLDTGDLNDIFARFCVRAFGVFCTQKGAGPDLINPRLCGSADAENLIYIFGKETLSQTIGASIDSIKTEDVLAFLSGNRKLDDSREGWPWTGSKSLIEKNGDSSYMLSLGHFMKYHQIFPVRNWDFSEFNKCNENGVNSYDLENCIVTPFCDDDSDVSSMTISEIRNDLRELNRLYNNSLSTDWGKANQVVGTIFKEATNEFIFSGFPESNLAIGRGLLHGVADFHLSELEYNSQGEVTNASSHKITFFIENKGTVTSRACSFILDNFPNTGGNNCTRMGYPWSKWQKNEARCAFIPEFENLIAGAYMTSKSINYINKSASIIEGTSYGFRNSVFEIYIEEFEKWVDEFYKTSIEPNYCLSFVSGKDLSGMLRAIRKSKNANGAIEVAKEYLTGDSFNKFRQFYDIIDDGGTIDVTAKCTSEMTQIIKNTCSALWMADVSSFNMDKKTYEPGNSYSNNGKNRYTGLSSAKLTSYFDGVIEMLKNSLKQEGENNTNSADVSKNSDEDDLKIGVYDYVKMLYDKWLACGENEETYKMQNMFGGSDPMFHFIDCAYNKIGQVMYLNIAHLVQSVMQSQTRSGYNLVSMLSSLYASNKFQILCIQNFMDLSNPDSMEKMFKPLSYLECEKPKNRPNFIVLMSYEPSSKLDVKGSDYPDDGFYLDGDENKYPDIIKQKQEGDLPVPAIGVCYGQQYQNYFTNIKVDMSSPQATEQSIMAKFMICGAYKEDKEGPDYVTYGQDLFSVYSNNSYTCTVTMLGCAWVQPMMYFVLQNVPMFSGSYWIIKVTHNIKPGFMTTTFRGVRMSKNMTRAAKGFILGATNDSVSDAGDNGVTQNPESAYANVDNDCPYAEYNPIEKPHKEITVDDAQAYCAETYRYLTSDEIGLTPAQAKGICANCYHESGFDPYMVIIDAKSGGRDHTFGGGIASFRYHGLADDLFAYYYKSKEKGDLEAAKFNEKVEATGVWQNNPVACSPKNRQALKDLGIVFPIDFDTQKEFIGKSTSRGKYKAIRGADVNTPKMAADVWEDVFESPAKKTKDRWENYGSWVESAIASNKKIDVEEDDSENENETTYEELAEGLRRCLEQSLRATNNYSDITVSVNKFVLDEDEEWYYFYVSNKSAYGAMFDCLVNTYGKWLVDAFFDVNREEVTVDLRLESENQYTILKLYDHREEYSSVEDIDNEFRLAAIKYLKQKNITNVEAARSVIPHPKPFAMNDELFAETFELSGDNSSIEDCDSVMGANTPADSSVCTAP